MAPAGASAQTTANIAVSASVAARLHDRGDRRSAFTAYDPLVANAAARWMPRAP